MQNKLIIVSAPSGAGKTTLVKHLLSQMPMLQFSVSCTTRQPRPNETHGNDYYFIKKEEFKNKINQQQFAEWEEVYPGCFYGTLLSEIERIWQQNKIVVFDIDVQGGINLKNKFKQQALSIFIQPPSASELERRLRNRNTETEEKLQTRIKKSNQELACAKAFDVVLINNQLEQAKQAIVNTCKHFINN